MSIIVKSRDSLLTTSSGFSNYRGILNLVIILLVLSNFRAALENVIKYGILVDPISWLLFMAEGSKHWPALLIVSGLSVHVLLALAIETVIAGRRSSKGSAIVTLATDATLIANLVACISIPPLIIYTCDTHPISTSGSLMLVSVVFLKLVSYHMMNFWCRDVRRPEKLQSRTTKSFLRSYVPPAVDFGSIPVEEEESQPQLLPKLSEKPEGINTNGVTANTLNGSPKKGASLRRRSSDKNNNNNKSRLANPTTSNSGKPAAVVNSSTDSESGSPGKLSSKDAKTRAIALQALAKYPENITLSDMLSYVTYPTLCYEIEFAKTSRIRKRFLIKRIAELIVLSQLDMALIQQWIVPTVSNSIIPFRQMQLSHMVERLLKLAIPNHVIWLIWFYMFFHSLLNIIAELTRFADRQFYKDWWNSESVYYFWSNWNIPVHKWCARHLYLPLLSVGFNKCQAFTAVFFVSAFFHEYLVSVPLKMFRMWAFTGMLMQLPWARFVSSYFNNYFANVAVWVSLIIGQPLCILMYYHDYYVLNNKALPVDR